MGTGTCTGAGSLDLDGFLLLEPTLVADSAARGLELLEGPAELNEASAVFADTEAVGGPEEKIDLEGVLNKEDCGVVSPVVVGGTGGWFVDAAICCWAGREAELVRGIGECGRRGELDEACGGRGEYGGKIHDESVCGGAEGRGSERAEDSTWVLTRSASMSRRVPSESMPSEAPAPTMLAKFSQVDRQDKVLIFRLPGDGQNSIKEQG